MQQHHKRCGERLKQSASRLLAERMQALRTLFRDLHRHDPTAETGLYRAGVVIRQRQRGSSGEVLPPVLDALGDVGAPRRLSRRDSIVAVLHGRFPE